MMRNFNWKRGLTAGGILGSVIILMFCQIIHEESQKPKINKTELSGYNPLQGASIGNLSPALADQIGMNLLSRGVVILEIRRSSSSQRFGFQPRDIIKEINGDEVRTVGQVQRLLLQKSKQWKLSISRNGKILSMAVNR